MQTRQQTTDFSRKKIQTQHNLQTPTKKEIQTQMKNHEYINAPGARGTSFGLAAGLYARSL